MARSTRRVASVVALVSLSVAALVAAAPVASGTTASAAAWLETQQQADGGFEVLGFPGFETADAVLALAAAAQSGSWSADQARNAIYDLVNANGKTPLSALDDYADSGSGGGFGAGQAAKLIVLVTNPLGLDPSSFDPDCDGEADLSAILGAPGANGTFGIGASAFNQILFAARAAYARDGQVPDATLTYIRNARKSDGSWDFLGSSAGTGGDVDTTSLAVQALLDDPDVGASDTDVVQALDYLEGAKQSNGAWQSFGTDDPNSTAVAVLALAAGGRTSALANSDAFLLSLQQPDGRIASPNDGFGVNTFATSQAIQGLLRANPPRATSTVASCSDADGVPDAIEDGAPNGGDGNNDGIRDAEQPNVTSTPAAVGGGYLTVESPAGTTLADVTVTDPATLPAPPAGVTLPSGVVGFTVQGVTVGATIDVRVYFPGSAPTGYYKFHDGAWLDVSSIATFASGHVTLALRDGGQGDDDAALNGTIVDPGGPAVVPTQQVPGGNGSAAGVVTDPTFTG